MIRWWPINDRMIIITISPQPFNMNIIQLYTPTSTHEDEEIDEFYDNIPHELQNVKSDEITIVMGDLNAKIGEGSRGDVVGRFGLGEGNERGNRLIQFCIQNNLSIMNTFFEHPKRRLYT